MPDPLITVDQNAVIGFNGWMPFPEDKNESFSFSLDPNLNHKIRTRYLADEFSVNNSSSSIPYDRKMFSVQTS